MDDGARSERFAPYFVRVLILFLCVGGRMWADDVFNPPILHMQANSGFFFLRHNARTLRFLTSLLFHQVGRRDETLVSVLCARSPSD